MFRKPPTPVVSEHSKLRTRQLSEFLKLNPTAQCVSSGGAADTTATYTLQFQTQQAGLLTLTLILGPLFPERPPVCQLTAAALASQQQQARLQHRYLDTNGYLSLHPKLQSANWSPHINLGLLVQEIVREFISLPPTLISAAAMPAFSSGGAVAAASSSSQPQPQPMHYNPNLYGQLPQHQQPPQGGMYAMQQQPPLTPFMQQPPQPQGYPQSSPLSSPQQFSQPPIPPRKNSSPSSLSQSGSHNNLSSQQQRTRPPDVPNSFPSLDALSIAQLEALTLGTPAEQQLAIKDLSSEQPQLTQMHEVQKSLCEEIEMSAQKNLNKKDELESLQQRVQIEHAKLKEQQAINASLLQRQQAATQKYSLTNILSLLDASITVSEDASEETKSRFEGISKSSADASEQHQAVLEQFIKERMLVHERQAKKERITETYGHQDVRPRH